MAVDEQIFLFDDINVLLEEICMFLKEDRLNLSPEDRSKAGRLINRCKEQIQEIDTFKTTQIQYVDMDKKKDDDQKTLQKKEIRRRNIREEESKKNEYELSVEDKKLPNMEVCPHLNLPFKDIGKKSKQGMLLWKSNYSCLHIFNLEKKKRVFACVYDSWFLMYNSEKDLNPFEKLDLKHHSSKEETSRKFKNNLFSVFDTKRSYSFQAHSSSDKCEWITAINTAHARLVGDDHLYADINSFNPESEKGTIQLTRIGKIDQKPPELPIRTLTENNDYVKIEENYRSSSESPYYTEVITQEKDSDREAVKKKSNFVKLSGSFLDEIESPFASKLKDDKRPSSLDENIYDEFLPRKCGENIVDTDSESDFADELYEFVGTNVIKKLEESPNNAESKNRDFSKVEGPNNRTFVDKKSDEENPYNDENQNNDLLKVKGPDNNMLADRKPEEGSPYNNKKRTPVAKKRNVELAKNKKPEEGSLHNDENKNHELSKVEDPDNSMLEDRKPEKESPNNDEKRNRDLPEVLDPNDSTLANKTPVAKKIYLDSAKNKKKVTELSESPKLSDRDNSSRDSGSSDDNNMNEECPIKILHAVDKIGSPANKRVLEEFRAKTSSFSRNAGVLKPSKFVEVKHRH